MNKCCASTLTWILLGTDFDCNKNMHILTYFTSIVAMESNSLIVVILINYICALKNNIHFCLRYFRNKGYEYCYYIDNLDVPRQKYIDSTILIKSK